MRQNCPLLCISSLNTPCSTTLPLSRTIILSAIAMVDSLWAITITVFPFCLINSTVCCTKLSAMESSDEVASSSISISGFLYDSLRASQKVVPNTVCNVATFSSPFWPYLYVSKRGGIQMASKYRFFVKRELPGTHRHWIRHKDTRDQ